MADEEASCSRVLKKEDSMNYFCVVKFLETNEVSVVPFNWIREDRCLWPPKNMRARVISHVEKGIIASEAWDLHPMHLLGIYATYKEARSKLPVAEVRSDLNSTDPEDCGRGKRQKKKRRLSSASTSSSLDLSYILESPPLLPNVNQSSPCFDDYQNDLSNSLTLHTLDDIENLPNSVSLLNPRPDTPVDNRLLSQTLSPIHNLGEKGHKKSRVQPTGKGQSSSHLGDYQNGSLLSSFSESSPVNNLLSHIGPHVKNSEGGLLCSIENLSASQGYSGEKAKKNVSGFEKFVIRQITEIKMNQRTLMDSMDLILRHISRQNPSREDVPEDDISSLLNLLPIVNCGDIPSLENKLGDEKIYRQLASFLSKLGGNSISGATKMILKKLINDDVASAYSYLGFREKKAFKSLKLCKLVLSAVRMHVLYKETCEAEVEKTISNWLRHAKTRMTKKKKI